MAKNLRQIGGSWGIIIPLAILKLLKVNPTVDDVELTVENDVLKITKIKKKIK